MLYWSQIKGDWKRFKKQVKAKWGRLTYAELNVIQGKRGVLAVKLREKYGIAEEEAEKQLYEFLKISQDIGRGD